MKNVLYFTTVVFLVLIFSACKENLLKTVPTDRISTDIYWKTEKDAIYAANSVYRYLDGITVVDYDGLTDILHSNVPFYDNGTMERGDFNSNTPKVYNQWGLMYKGIRAANNFLENVDQVSTTNTILIGNLKSEVRVIRAYLYLKLVMLWGDVPLVTKTIATVSEGQSVTRNTTAEIWKFINSELDVCASVLPLTQTEKGRITKGAALALKARALLYQNKWSEAATVAKSVMDLNKYSLYPKYEDLFSTVAENNAEIILDKQFIKDIYSNNAFQYLGPYSQKNANSTFVPTKKMIDSYTMSNGKSISDPTSGYDKDKPYDNRDPRLKFSVFVKGSKLSDGKIYDPTPGSKTLDEVGSTYLATVLGFNIKKYVNADDLANISNCGINIILIRYAEILLTYAEGKIESDQIDQSVYDAINSIRQGRNDVKLPVIASGLSKTELRVIVRNERKVELAFEGLRLFDLRRWKTAGTEIPGFVEGMTYKNTSGAYVTIKLDGFLKVFDASKHYLWPIPKKEIDLNSNLKQNTGW
mgnify:CR=1 FL=1